MKKKVFVGLSGGVDSSVAALLLKNKGYDVTGVFMKNWSGEDYGVEDLCPWKEDLRSAREAAEHMGIPLKVYNFEKEYRELVVKDFFEQYRIGNTPNPDVLCNKFIKFDKFLNKALEEGADYIATGHYAKTSKGSLFKAKDRKKDQTYFLHQLTQQQLSSSLFPLGEITKSDVRRIAKKNGLPNALKPDSQGICFIGEIDIVDFLKKELKEKTGDIVDEDTKDIVGQHKGVWFYTLGQRKGIGVGGSSEPYFVSGKDVETNTLFVVKSRKNPKLWKNTVTVEDFHYINRAPKANNLTGTIRYRAEDKRGKLRFNKDNSVIFEFEKEQWAPALGQSLVLYEGARCVGGGVITAIKA